jgi:group I intron endonuclease
MIAMSDDQVLWKGFRAFAWNLPLARPGVYLITNLLNGKRYVGISVNLKLRLRVHRYGSRTPTKLKGAFDKYGIGSFLIEPIYYSLDGTDHLPVIEADLIAVYDSIRNGYNVMAAFGNVGPAGPVFAETVARAWDNRDDTKQRLSEFRRAQWQDPEIRAAQCAAMVEASKRPEVKQRRSAAKSRSWKDHALRDQNSRANKLAWADPALLAEHAARFTGRIYITDGITTRMVFPHEPLAEGWHIGVGPSISMPPNASGKRWITDGISEAYILEDAETPPGWKHGRKPRLRHVEDTPGE